MLFTISLFIVRRPFIIYINCVFKNHMYVCVRAHTHTHTAHTCHYMSQNEKLQLWIQSSDESSRQCNHDIGSSEPVPTHSLTKHTHVSDCVCVCVCVSNNTHTHTNPRISDSSEVRAPRWYFRGCGFESLSEVKFSHLNRKPFLCQSPIICTQKHTLPMPWD